MCSTDTYTGRLYLTGSLPRNLINLSDSLSVIGIRICSDLPTAFTEVFCFTYLPVINPCPLSYNNCPLSDTQLPLFVATR